MLRYLGSAVVVLAFSACGPAPSPPGPAGGDGLNSGRENALPKVAPEATDDTPGPAAEDGVYAAMAKFDDVDDNDQLKAAMAGLEKALAADPANVDGLQTYWEHMREVETPDGNPDYSFYRRTADLVRRALAADGTLSDQPDFRSVANDAFYNDACAKSRDRQPKESLTALREAVKFGWENLAHLSEDADLALVRESPDYADFFAEAEKAVETARQERKKHLVARVVEQLAATEPFEFTFDVKDVTGKPLSKADFAGKILIVDIWGTWCGPCLKEIPHFIALHKKYRDQGLEIVGLNTEGGEEEVEADTETVRNFVKEREVPYSCALLTPEISEQVPNLTSVPTTLFFDRKGILRLRAVGYTDLLKLEVIVEQLLQESAQ